jgi:transglutaminase-like putative cysteine protease
MHAWVSVWCGEEAGWQGLDPTNAVRAGMDHIPLGFGRDYGDVSPLDGVIVDAGSHSVATAVDVAQRV